NAETVGLDGWGISVLGTAHSNAATHVVGTSLQLLGGTEFARWLRQYGKNIVVNPPAVRVAPSAGNWVGIADYRPGSPNAVAAGTAYFDVTSRCRYGVWRPAAPLPPGLYYARCNVSLTSAVLPSRVTIAAEGTIDLWTSPGARTSPYVDGVQLVSGSGARDAIDVNARGSDIGGALVARNGGIWFWGYGTRFRCSMLAGTIEVSGDFVRLDTPTCS
ncbi:MAG TPA: hypothetical protein VEP49_00005, partial [Acidimicrobiia bacterium]|nr:hypothetical protein [Acidimicrobiia bacterium]